MAGGHDKKKKNTRWLLPGILLALVAVLLFFILRIAVKKEIPDKEPTAEEIKVHLYQKMPDTGLYDENAEVVMPFSGNTKAAVSLFWASYCPHCKDGVMQIDSLARTTEELGAEFLLINKLDGIKETEEQAFSMLNEMQINEPTLLDRDCAFYEALGLNMIPTVLVSDEKNRVICLSEGRVPTQWQLTQMILEAKTGKAAFLSEKIEARLMGEDGGIRTNYQEEGSAVPSGADVLSESQGIMMLYAALAGNEELLEKLFTFVNQNRFPEGLMPWVISDKTASQVNALVDDLRIVRGLYIAGKDIADYADAIYAYNTDMDCLVDFYDRESGEKANRFTLCYGDLYSLSLIKENDKRFEAVYENTRELMQNGRISETFPLYYSYYDYDQERYFGERLNMAEALTTLFYLAEAGNLPVEALDWLEKEMNERGCIYSAYDLEGNPAEDGFYESTAVYALTAMTALSQGREALAGKAINRMEQFRITEEESEFYGLFGNSDGTGIYSFDQGMALLAYEYFERKTE